MLIGHWPLIGNTNDYSGFGNNGTPTNITYTAGKIGQAGDFNGNGSRIDCSTFSIPAGKTSLSFSVWWKYDGQGFGSDKRGFVLESESNFALSFLINTNGQLGVHINTTTTTSQYQPGFVPTNGVWYHTAVVWNGTNLAVYINGTFLNSRSQSGTSQVVNALKIGTYRDSDNRWWLGQINDVRVYDHALSEYEIKELAKAKIIHYTFDSADEVTGVRDVSGFNNNGTLFSGATVTSSSDGRVGSRSMEFNGTGGFYTSPITLPTYTIAFWANRDAENKMAIGSNGETINFNFYWYGDNSWRYIHGGVGGEFYYPKTDSIPIGTWGHYAATYDGANVRIYRNGKFEGSQATTGSASFNPGISIGYGYNNSSFFYDGKLDDVRVYATALSAADVLALYNRRANFDNLGNASTNELDEYNFSTNYNLNDKGQITALELDEYTGTQNTNAQQEIKDNGTLYINGEFSEVD
jgi:hypothetical protein